MENQRKAPPAVTAVSTWTAQTLVVWCRLLSSADFAISHHKPGLSWWAARLIKVSTQPEWSSTFRKLTQETGKSSEAKTTLIMHPVWDLPIWCMKDNQEMWIGTESQPFVNYQYPLECFSSSTFLINKAIIFVGKHLTESSDHPVNTHNNALRDNHPEDPTEARRRLDIIAQCLQTHIRRKLFLSRIILHCKHSFSHQKANHTVLRPHAVFNKSVPSARADLYVRARATRRRTCLRIMSQCAAPESGVGVWGWRIDWEWLWWSWSTQTRPISNHH